MTTKNNKRWATGGSKTIVLAAGATGAHSLLGGKTLGQVGAEFDLADEDVQWGFGTNPNNNTEIMSLVLNVKDTLYQIPISRSLTNKAEMLKDPAFLLGCQFRVTFKSLKEEDGVTPKLGDNGEVMLDETAPYMSLGSPSGIVIERMEAAFKDAVEEDGTDADVAVGTANVKA